MIETLFLVVTMLILIIVGAPSAYVMWRHARAEWIRAHNQWP